MGTDPALAEYLPVLYRVALDSIDELARAGGRREAARLRARAGRVYSRAWDESCRRALDDIIVRAHAASGTAAPALPLPGIGSLS
ncbi:MAG: hypothetical protein ABI628_10145 [Chloroflexota bacterium]